MTQQKFPTKALAFHDKVPPLSYNRGFWKQNTDYTVIGMSPPPLGTYKLL